SPLRNDRSNSNPPTTTRTNATTANASARRTRIGTLRSRGAPEPVPDSADGLQVVAAERSVDLLPEVGDVLVDDVRAAVEREVPGVVEDLGAADPLAGVPHQQLQQRHLLRRQ